MEFYQSISEYYDHIFPHNIKKTYSLLKMLGISDNSSSNCFKIIDAGCATGALAEDLAERGFSVFSFDLDQSMINIAVKRCAELKNAPVFKTMNMLKIDSVPPEYNDGVLCLGNTLVHLVKKEDMTAFINKCFAKLAPGKRLVLQIINYDRILDNHIDGLSTIENEIIRFERRYIKSKNPSILFFDTRLTIKKNGQIIENRVSLKALRKKELETLVVKAGFCDLKFYGDYEFHRFSENSIPLILSAGKPL